MIPDADFRNDVVRPIGEAIERAGWSQTAQACGINRITLHRAFGRRGRGRPTLRTIERVLPHLGLELRITEVQR